MQSNFRHLKKRRIEFGELQIGEIARKHLMDVCDSNWASAGPKVEEFELLWGELFGYRYNIALSSGTDACLNACLALHKIGRPTKPTCAQTTWANNIIVPALSFIATANAVRAAGFIPRFVDIRKETLNINEDLIEEAIDEHTVAIMCVHTMGKPCNMEKINEIAGKYELVVIEDACEAHGAERQGKFVGHWGDMAAFSFYQAHLVNCGEGGMLSTNNKKIYDLVNSTKCHGRSGLYFDHPHFGLNSKMNDMEASIGLEGLHGFWNTFNRRKTIHEKIRKELAGYQDYVYFSEQHPGDRNCPHAFSITLADPDQLRFLTARLDFRGVHWKRNFGCIPTQHKAFSYLWERNTKRYPEAEFVGDNGIHVGVHQHLSDDDVDYLINALQEGLYAATTNE